MALLLLFAKTVQLGLIILIQDKLLALAALQEPMEPHLEWVLVHLAQMEKLIQPQEVHP